MAPCEARLSCPRRTAQHKELALELHRVQAAQPSIHLWDAFDKSRLRAQSNLHRLDLSSDIRMLGTTPFICLCTRSSPTAHQLKFLLSLKILQGRQQARSPVPDCCQNWMEVSSMLVRTIHFPRRRETLQEVSPLPTSSRLEAPRSQRLLKTPIKNGPNIAPRKRDHFITPSYIKAPFSSPENGHENGASQPDMFLKTVAPKC
jgi:hypothetical protein